MGNFCSLTGPFYFRTLFGHAVINRGIVGKLWNAYGISPRAQSARDLVEEPRGTVAKIG